MPKIGDRVTVTVHGPNTLAGTATSTGSTAIGVGVSIIAKGKIIGDLGDQWLIELDDPLLGNKRMAIPKTGVPV